MEAAAATRVRTKRSLPLERGALQRHPDDGWTLADPYPMRGRVRRSFRAIIRAVCPPAPAPISPEIVDRVELHVRRFMRYMHPIAARGLWLLILMLDWAPRLLFKSVRRLCSLDREQAAQILSAVVHSRFNVLRTLMVGVRGVILSAYFDQDEVHRALGYAPIPFLRDRVRLRKQLLLSGRASSG